MKKLLLILLFCIAFFFTAPTVFAQPSLSYEKQGLIANMVNDMQITNYAEPGSAGSNQIWDFTNLEDLSDFSGNIYHVFETKSTSPFSDCDIELSELENRFYFKLVNNKLEQHGYMSADGNLVIRYDVPFVKMQYPFSYGDNFNGNFSGTYMNNSLEAAILGSYSVEADAYGSLKLPNNLYIDNTLRVKTSKEYTRTFEASNPHEIKIITYRWYCEYERFPLLVLTSVEMKANGTTSNTYQAAFKKDIALPTAVELAKATNKEAFMGIYPNPFREEFTMEYNLTSDANVKIEMYNNLGKKVDVILDTYQIKGSYSIDYKPERVELAKEVYFIRYTIGSETRVEKLVQLK